jgi:hypothetical protein
MPKKRTKTKLCPSCNGAGVVCCETWGVVRANAGHDLEFSGMGLPMWPLGGYLEMPRCPFCGREFKPSERSK